MTELIEDLKNRNPIRVILDGDDFGIYKFNEEKERYEGIIGYLTLDKIKMILREEIDHIKIRRM